MARQVDNNQSIKCACHPPSMPRCCCAVPRSLFASRSACTHNRSRGLANPSRRQDEPLVALGGDFIALLLVGSDAADIGHEDPRLARNIGAHVPGVRQRIERAVGDLVGVLDPGILGSLLWLDALQAIVAQMFEAMGDPVDMLLAAEN